MRQTSLPVFACISLEPWDEVWRRNQHFASRLVRSGRVSRLIFIEPPHPGRGRRLSPMPGVEVLRPALIVPKRWGGLRLVGWLLRRRVLRDVQVLWVNDPQLGVHCLGRQDTAVYDVTDDWREFEPAEHVRDRIVEGEDVLARRARTIVCSEVLAERWRERYEVDAVVVQNAVDVDAVRAGIPVDLGGPGPHAGYVGTLHEQRLDLQLVAELARSSPGTVHLVGPDALSPEARESLIAQGVVIHPPAKTADVPRWLAAFDVLLCPHLVDPFTMSLDAIKAHEYLATDKPIVATPTSGFQALVADGLHVVPATAFTAKVLEVSADRHGLREVASWDDRTAEFAWALGLDA